MSEYTEQAQAFADKYNVTMTAEYLGHFPRLNECATANYRITLERKDKKPFSFDFSTSINDSWSYIDLNTNQYIKKTKGIPQRLKKEYWPKTGQKQTKGNYELHPTQTKPTLYDVLTCLQKNEVGTHEDFCSEFGYDEDSRKGFDVYQAVLKEWHQVNNMFFDCLEELQEIN